MEDVFQAKYLNRGAKDTHTAIRPHLSLQNSTHTIERAFVFTNQVIISLTIHLHMQLPSLLHRKADFCRCFFTIFPSKSSCPLCPQIWAHSSPLIESSWHCGEDQVLCFHIECSHTEDFVIKSGSCSLLPLN